MGDEEGDGDYYEEGDLGEELEEEMTEAETDERADLNKLLQQHPSIWIPFEETVKELLIPAGPGDKHHTTYPFLSNYEKTKLLSLRTSQIEKGAHPYIAVPEGVTSSYDIAQLELKEKKLPYILKRPLPNGTYEYWRLTDLVILE
jgi:DNA-directed RNA polymerase I, II, and III subunit RPABC2